MREYNFPFNGHYYWSTREFVPGSVFFNGTLYENVPLNVNAHTQDLLARESSFAAPVVAERGLTAWFKIDGIYYYNLQYYGVEGAPEGFFQLLTDGRRNVWMQRRKLFARSPGDHNGDKGIGYDDPDYREKLITYFYQQDKYYVERDGAFKRIRPGRSRRAAMRPGLPLSTAEPDVAVPRTIRRSPQVKGAAGSLPAEWFSAGDPSAERRAMLAAIEQENLIASYRNKTYEIGSGDAATATVSGVVRAVASGEADGWCKVLSDKATGRILGVHMMGAHSSDIIHEAAVLAALGVTTKNARDIIHAHPTLSEVLAAAIAAS
jgi:hypothetical protein